MDYRILGPLEVFVDGRPLELSGARQRALLAVLLLRRDEVVSTDRLVDALWGEHPPASANKALQNAVLQIRRALGSGAAALQTRGGGYVLEVAPGELDVDHFERLAAEGREALQAGDAKRAAERLRAALGVWRGPPLADIDHDVFAAGEVRRLEEERLAVAEDRIDADLALGRHAELVPELEEAVVRHPLRERLRAQLMLALYADGRQADALEVFHDARRTLDEELGIEPGPRLRETHEAVLRQDPELATSPPRRRAAGEPRPARLVAAAGAALLAAVVAAGIVLATGGEQEGERTAEITGVPGNSLVAIDPTTARVVATYPVGSTPTSVATGAGATWTVNADDATLTRVSAAASEPRTLSVPGTPLDVAAGPDVVWALGGRVSHFQGSNVPQRLFEIEPETGAIRRDIKLPSGKTAEWFALDRLAVGPDAVWALGADDRLLRLDPRSEEPPEVVRGVRASSVVADGDAAWVVAESRDSRIVLRVSRAGRVTARVPIASPDLDGLVAGAGAVWATAPQSGLLWRITVDGTRSIDVGAGARGVTFAAGSLWVANASRGTVSRVDPDGDVTAVVQIGNAPRGLAFDGKRVWVSVAEAGGAPARDSARAAVGAVAAPVCGDVIAGAEPPERFIVSDLPLQQPGLSALPDAIAFVLRKHDFRAGDISLGYQSCDDSTAKQGSFEPEKCRANAALYARTPGVIGIVGPFNSDCATEQLATTNEAPGGPLAMVSPTNTVLLLTKPVPGVKGSPVDRFYPTGIRHYARVAPTDDGQGTAIARFADSRDVERLAIVYQPDEYGMANAHYAELEAKRLAMKVIGPFALGEGDGARRARRLAERIAAARPDALMNAAVPFFGPAGEPLPHMVLVRELAGRVGRDLLLIGTDAWGFADGVLGELGELGERVHVAYTAISRTRLPRAGREWLKEFAATQPGGVVTEEAVYTAQATEVLLDAIARSDGTRASVTAGLLDTRLDDSLIGDVSFDEAGDVQPAGFTIFRIDPRVDSDNGLAPDGSNVVDVIAP